MPNFISVFIGAVIFAQMFLLALQYQKGSMRDLIADKQLLIKSLLSVLVVVPIVASALIWLLPLQSEVAIGVAILAACPAAPLTTRRAMASSADIPYVSALQLLLAMTALVFTPVCILWFTRAFNLDLPTIAMSHIVSQIAMVTFLPAILGGLTARYAKGFLNKYPNLVPKIAGILWMSLPILVIVMLLASPEFRANLMIGWSGIFAVICLAAIAYSGGWLLGGSRLERKSGLAMAALARNAGLALYIANMSTKSVASIPTIIVYLLVGFIVGLAGHKILSRSSQ